MMNLVIGSEDQAINDAVRRVFGQVHFFADRRILYTSIKTNSSVRPQPLSSTETLEGAINRAKDALSNSPDADLAVGLEDGVELTAHGIFVGGWVAIFNREGKYGFGSSSWVMLPESFREGLLAGKELIHLIDRWFGAEDLVKIRHGIGTNGVLTGSLYTRTDELEHAVKCALAPIIKPDYYRPKT